MGQRIQDGMSKKKENFLIIALEGNPYKHTLDTEEKRTTKSMLIKPLFCTLNEKYYDILGGDGD